MRLILIALLAATLPAYAQPNDPRGRPMQEMQGDCSNYRVDLKREFTLWQQQPIARKAASAGEAPHGVLQPDQRTSVTLLPSARVRFAVKPAEDRGGPDKFSGTLPVARLAPGTWRLSASSGAWIDLTAGQRLLDAPSFEMQTKCQTIFKTVTFIVPENAALVLQLNGSPRPVVDVLLTRVP
jgi:hypothetical protein